jgi:hypothetical protein
MSESTKAEVRRLRNILTERGEYWDLQWGLPRLQAAYRLTQSESSRNHPGMNSKPCVLVSVMFEIISVDNFSHGYGSTDSDISIVAGDPLSSETFDVAPLACEKASNQIQLYVSMGELRGLCLHIILSKIRSQIAFPLDDLLLTPAGQFPAEVEISMWNIGTGVKTGTAKMRVKVALNHSVTEMGRSYQSIVNSRQPKTVVVPDRAPSFETVVPGQGYSRQMRRSLHSEVKSLAEATLLAKRDSLRVQVSELRKDNDRLRILLAQESN